MRSHLVKLWDSLRATYWFVPLVMVAATVPLWWCTNEIDASLERAGKLPLRWLYTDDFESLRTLLLTIVGTMVGTIGVVYSVLMVPLTLAASQFGPRLLRNFLRDSFTHVTLGTFLATISFCLLVLLQLRDESQHRQPQVSINTAMLLGFCSFAVVVYFIHHVSVSIQAPVLAADVSRKLHEAIEREYPHPWTGKTKVDLPANGLSARSPDHTVLATVSGYVQVRDDKTLFEVAVKGKATLQLLHEPGAFLTKDTPLARVWSEAALPPAFDAVVQGAFITGPQRTLVQDVTFGINELVELALRALSPAINDPFTAMTCLDWLGTALCRLCAKQFDAGRKTDTANQLRIVSKPVTFTQLTHAAFSQIREYGRGSAAVTLRLMETITTVMLCARTEEQRQALHRHAQLVKEGCQIGLPQEADRKFVTEQYEKVQRLAELHNV